MAQFQITDINSDTTRVCYIERDGVRNRYYELGMVGDRLARVAQHTFGRGFDLGSLKVGESVITNGNIYKRVS